MTSIFDPAEPAGAFDAFVGDAARASRAQRAWVPDDGPLPALCTATALPRLFDDALWLRQLLDWSLSLPKPKAVLIVSAHWEAAPLSPFRARRGHAAGIRLRRLPPPYYAMKYPTPDATQLAHQAAGQAHRPMTPSTCTPGAALTTARGCR